METETHRDDLCPRPLPSRPRGPISHLHDQHPEQQSIEEVPISPSDQSSLITPTQSDDQVDVQGSPHEERSEEDTGIGHDSSGQVSLQLLGRETRKIRRRRARV